MSSNKNNRGYANDAETEAWFRNRPKWTVTTVCICEKCGRAYKPSLGHKPENCVPIETNFEQQEPTS